MISPLKDFVTSNDFGQDCSLGNLFLPLNNYKFSCKNLLLM